MTKTARAILIICLILLSASIFNSVVIEKTTIYQYKNFNVIEINNTIIDYNNVNTKIISDRMVEFWFDDLLTTVDENILLYTSKNHRVVIVTKIPHSYKLRPIFQ